jgi:hypothetical protein
VLPQDMGKAWELLPAQGKLDGKQIVQALAQAKSMLVVASAIQTFGRDQTKRSKNGPCIGG